MALLFPTERSLAAPAASVSYSLEAQYSQSWFVSGTTLPLLLVSQIKDPTLDGKDFVAMVKGYHGRLGYKSSSSHSELAAFTAYAQAFPDGLLALVDTYDTLQSGVPNFLCVALALDDLGHRYVGRDTLP